MPKMNGLEFSKKIRTLSNTPIIITTAYTTTQYLLEAIELNLVKYLIKPIVEEKLKKALKICFNYLEKENTLVIDLTSQHTYNALNHTLITNKSEITSLTITQTKFLDLLIKHKNRAVSYEEIENHIWHAKGMSEAALRSLIYDLRQMTHKNVIKNVSKIGYRVQLHG
jgi:DNA-binding response OmpR family regulator